VKELKKKVSLVKAKKKKREKERQMRQEVETKPLNKKKTFNYLG